MAYLGSPPASQFFAPGTDTFSGTGSQTAFTLSRNVATVNDILVVVNNVDQQPSNYTVLNNVLTFSPAPSAGTNNIYVRYLSTNLTAIVPQQGSVGIPAFSATGTPSASTYLRGDNTWSTVSTGTVAVSSGGTGLTSTPANGALDIGNGTGFTRTTLTAGSGISITNGAGSISIAASGGGGGGFSNWQIFTSSGTFTVPAGVTKVKVTVVGGGAGGMYAGFVGGCPGSTFNGPGGSAGGAAIEIISGLTPGGTVSVTVGVGGSGANGNIPTNPTAGGTSSFGAFCSATGGATLAGAGGLGSGGDLNIRGGAGSPSPATTVVSGGQLFNAGVGGSSILGGGGTGGVGSANGGAGGAYGGGGGGAENLGGAGAAGVVIVEY